MQLLAAQKIPVDTVCHPCEKVSSERTTAALTEVARADKMACTEPSTFVPAREASNCRGGTAITQVQFKELLS